MTPTKPKPKPPSHSRKHICLAFESEAKYGEIVADAGKFRAHLDQAWREHPEIFSRAFAGGFRFHDLYRSRKQKGLVLRRIELKENGSIFTVRPSFVMLYGCR